MKIHRLSINNLNSLKGEHEIKFDLPPLADTGLFAIVGETGAGKTTLLDAITLALYGQIDREKESSGGGGRIMTYGTATCHAELEFSTSSGLYRARWERSLAHKKIGGKLQAPAHIVSVWDEDSNDWKFLAEKITETKAVIPEVTGLDYGRFTRSVMLPQGAFARFLQADENERADLLEQITGTGIYRDISIAAFERHKLAVKEHESIQEKLSNLQLLTGVEREVVQATLATETQQLAEQTAQLKQLQPQLKIFQQLTEGRSILKSLQQRLAELEVKLAAEKSQRQQLQASDRLSGVAEQLRTYQSRREEIASSKQQLTAAQSLLTQQQTAGEILLKTAETTDDKLIDFLDKKEGRELAINEAVVLEAREKSLAEAAEKYALQTKALRTSMLENKTKLSAKEAQLQALAAANLSLRSEISSLFPESDATASLDELALLLLDHLATLKSDYQRSSELLAQSKLAVKLGQLRLLQANTSEAEASVTKALKLANTTHEKLETNLGEAREMLEQLLQSHRLTELKESLESGDACPVCGSTDHPALAHWLPPSDALVARQRQELASAKKALAEQKEKLEKAHATHTSAREKSVFAQTQLAELSQEWGSSYPGQHPQKASPEEVATLTEKLGENQARQARVAASATQLKRRLETGGERPLQEAVREIKAVVSRFEIQLNELLPEQEKQLSALTTTRQSLRSLLKGGTVESARQLLKKEEANLRAAGDSARKALVTHQRLEEGSAASIKVLEKSLQELQSGQERLERALLSTLQPLGIPDISTAQKSLLTAAEAQHLRTSFSALDQQLHSLKTQFDEQSQRIRSLEAESEQLEQESQLNAKLVQLEAACEASNRQIGAYRQQLKADDSQKAAAGELAESLVTAEKERQRWAELDELIGSAKGDRFSRFAQSLTLDRLVAAANEQLAELLDGRYLIDRKPSVYRGKNPLHLGLEIIDTFQADNRRDTQTLSGGESFLVSLALALGLSELAGGNAEIRSLFIDEGFGSLDEGLLDTVIDSLENLRAKGKTIGLISHVKELRERIHHKIVVEKRGDGFSTLIVR